MDENMMRAALTVLVNDQAYLYASIQALEFKIENGYVMDEDVFERMQDEFKEEFAVMVTELSTGFTVTEALDEIDIGLEEEE